mmetsp:Transcript_20988/g.47381  ORF Transcript_20988/g.47381 Transcript_20988/m.47381 type:complete len:203 (-) Transcript_20988:4-612(-)
MSLASAAVPSRGCNQRKMPLRVEMLLTDFCASISVLIAAGGSDFSSTQCEVQKTLGRLGTARCCEVSLYHCFDCFPASATAGTPRSHSLAANLLASSGLLQTTTAGTQWCESCKDQMFFSSSSSSSSRRPSARSRMGRRARALPSLTACHLVYLKSALPARTRGETSAFMSAVIRSRMERLLPCPTCSAPSQRRTRKCWPAK